MPGIVILGAGGAIGRNLGHELDRRGIEFRAVGRNAQKLQAGFSNRVIRVADLADPDQARTAVVGATTVFYTVGVEYHHFELHPLLMQKALEACAAESVPQMVVVTSVYSYGWPRMNRVTEEHPREPQSRKGRYRKEQEDLALDAHWMSRVRAAVVHLPDFYGPYADQSLSNPIFAAALAGKKANWLGSVDLPHEFVYTPDAARTLLDLAGHDEAYGHRWNLGGAGTITGREFITAVYREAGQKPKWRAVTKWMLQVGGVFNPLLRELREMYYLGETPVILDDSRLEALIGPLQKTPYEKGIRETMAWMKTAGGTEP